MIKSKKTAKVTVGRPLEVQFVNSGYELHWDSRVKMSAVERRFFCDYVKCHSMALIYFGAVNVNALANSAPSLRVLHSLAVNFLRMAARSQTPQMLQDAVDKKIQQMLPQLKNTNKIPVESLYSIYSGLVACLCEKSGGDNIATCVENIYVNTVASLSVCFSIDEGTGLAETPYKLMITCSLKGKDTPINTALETLKNDEDAKNMICVSIAQAAKKSELIARIYNGGDMAQNLLLSHDDMHTFLKELELYASCSITCRIPNSWKKQRSRLSIGMTFGNKVVGIGTDSLLNFDINLSIDGEKLTQDEIAELLAKQESIFMFRGRWVELKNSEMRSCLAAYESLLAENQGGLALADAMRAYLNPESLLPEDDDYELPDIVIDNSEFLERLHNGFDISALFDVSKPSESFTASLRPYQYDGVKWLNLMREMGIGACLSDDMGLGKTVQAIAVIEQMRHEKQNRTLIVIPASLLQNWQDELIRFAPKIKFRILHNSFGTMDITEDEKTDVFITTYSMLARLRALRTITWDMIILDEAQAIKNPQTMQSKAAKALAAKFRIAMTGTPIENSITDLWSIFDFLNPQMFRNSIKTLMAGMSMPEQLTDKLKTFVRPFILRRLKTDKRIITDLPEKIEMKSYCSLTQRQAILYKQITNSLSDEIHYMTGMERRGLVLTSILRLKQICNHPDQYAGQGTYQQSESGKFMRMLEICSDIKIRHERVLVFTQFKEMCEPLSAALTELFGVEGLIIHGSTSVGERGRIVERFNDPNEYIPYIVLSLRAGGVGLNLTAANHVIHFDRWWNPAVENQATDRAFRIGQTSNVIVHKLICMGTLEEKIDRLIAHKSDIASDIVENDVKLTELSNEELLSLLHMDE